MAIEQSKDENLSNNVDTIIRIFRKTQKGKGKLKFCINLYHTNNSVMVNGSDVTLFNRNHQIIVSSIMNTANVKSLDSEIFNMIMAQLKNMSLSKSKLSSKSTKLKSLPYDDFDMERHNNRTGSRNGKGDNEQIQEVRVTDLQQHPTLSLMAGQQMDEDDESNSLDFCPHCSSYVESWISCDACELWFHYQCEGLDPLDGYGDCDSYKCISCSQDEDLLHSLGDMDMQRGDEARISINDDEVEILNNSNPLISDAAETDTSVKATSGVCISPVLVDNVPEWNDRPNSDSKKATCTESINQDCKNTAITSKQSKKSGKKQTVANEKLQENLNFAKSYISKLERKLLELENSNKILRIDVDAQEPEVVRETSRIATCRENTVPNNNTQYRSHDIDELKNQMKNIEIECLKTRMAMIEQNVMSQRLQYFQSYPPPGHQLNPIPGIHIPLVHQPYANMTPFPHPYMAPFAHNPQIPFAPPMYGHGPMMPPFVQLYATPAAQNLLGPPIWYNKGRSAQAPTQMESSRSTANMQTRTSRDGEQNTYDKQPMAVDSSRPKTVRQDDKRTTGREPSGNKGATEQQEIDVIEKTSGRVDSIVESEVDECHNIGIGSICLDVMDGGLKDTCDSETDIGAQELNDSCQIMELNESTLELESENSSKSNSEPFLGAGRASETKWIAQ